jgi:hypothetical protein
MFCMRSVREAYPQDPSGIRFSPACEGDGALPEDVRDDPRAARLVAFVDRRETTVAALDQVLGHVKVANSQTFGEDELQEFTWKLLPFYVNDPDDPAMDKLMPRSTEALARVMNRLSDEQDPDATAVRETITRLSSRLGYRTPERVLAAVRPMLTFDRLDELSASLLAVMAPGSPGHDAFLELLQGTSLELAEPAEPKSPTSTLSLALELLLTPDPLYVEAEKSKLDPLPVLKRNDAGDAIAIGGATDESPFPVVGRADDAERAQTTMLALASANEPAYETFDANQTALASLMRDSLPLVRRGEGKQRSAVEGLLRGLQPLLGPTVTRTETFGAKKLTYQGPDVENGPMGNFLWALTSLLKLPETKPMLQLLRQLLEENENGATQLVNLIYNVDEKSDDPLYKGQLNGKNELWDDLIQMGQRIVQEKPAVGNRVSLLRAILDTTMTAEAPPTGIVLGHQMAFKDVPRLSSPMDVNSKMTTGCPKPDAQTPAPAYCIPVERMSGGDVGMNRSVFQRMNSVNHVTYTAPNCNKEGATLTVPGLLDAPTTFPNPFFGLGGIIGCPASSVAPPPASSYKECALIKQERGAVAFLRGILGTGSIVIRDEEVPLCAAVVGKDPSETQEKASGINGFTLNPTSDAIARYIYHPRNKFLTDLFNPFLTSDGVPLSEYEPNGLYGVELIDPAAQINGTAQSFKTVNRPLLGAFDARETFTPNGDAVNGYLYAELFDAIHMHYSSPQTELCPAKVQKGREGCTQSVDPTKKFFAYGTNAVSYEALLSWSMLDQDLFGVLNRSTKAIAAVNVKLDDGSTKKGIEVLHDFLAALLVPNPDLAYKDGRTYAKTNLCLGPDPADATKCACPAGSTPSSDGLWCKTGESYKRRGRIIPGGVPPIYLLLDALSDIDTMWEADEERHQAYLDGRGGLVDQLLKVDQAADKSTRFKSRRAYAFTRKALSWLLERMDDHKSDLEPWADGLVDRLAVVLAHPVGARAVDVMDKVWESKEASDELAALMAHLLDEQANPGLFQDLIVAVADSLTLLDKDPNLTPAIRFVSLGLSEQALDAVNRGGDTPDVGEGAAYRFLEVTRAIAQADKLGTLAKVLANASLPMEGDLSGKSPLEVLIDLVADMNRLDPKQAATVTLSPDDNQRVFEQLNEFMTDSEIGLERLYQVIEHRKLKP